MKNSAGAGTDNTDFDLREPVVSPFAGGSTLARNVSWNFLGLALPALLAIACTPLLVHQLGTDRFGILLLSWTVVGYFGIFDLGLSRALTQLVASALGSGRLSDVPSLVWTSIALLAVGGCVGALIMALLAGWINVHLLHPSTGLRDESLNTLYVLSLSVPVVVVGSGLRGVLEALQRFDYVNAVRVPLGIITYAGPAAMVPFTRNLAAIVALLMVGRLAACAAQAALCIRALPALRLSGKVQVSLLPKLLRLGGWMTVSNALIPFIAYGDRFVISALLSVSAVAYYAAPFDTITKLLIVPTAINFVLFPAFATLHQTAPERVHKLVSHGVRYALLLAFPICLVICGFAREGLDAWLGPEFANHSTLVAQLITLGVFANILAQTPYTLIQGIGRPDVTTKLLLAEVPLYGAALLILIHFGGLEGAGAAWVVRTLIEGSVLFLIAWRLCGSSREDRSLLLVGGLGLLFMSAFLVPLSLTERAILVVADLVVFGGVAWIWLAKNERSRISSWLRSPNLAGR